MKEHLKNIWKDPVWSKVIAVGICTFIGYLYTTGFFNWIYFFSIKDIFTTHIPTKYLYAFQSIIGLYLMIRIFRLVSGLGKRNNSNDTTSNSGILKHTFDEIECEKKEEKDKAPNSRDTRGKSFDKNRNTKFQPVEIPSTPIHSTAPLQRPYGQPYTIGGKTGIEELFEGVWKASFLKHPKYTYQEDKTWTIDKIEIRNGNQWWENDVHVYDIIDFKIQKLYKNVEFKKIDITNLSRILHNELKINGNYLIGKEESNNVTYARIKW